MQKNTQKFLYISTHTCGNRYEIRPYKAGFIESFFVILERNLRREGGLAHVLDWTGNDDNDDFRCWPQRQEEKKIGMDDGQFLSQVSALMPDSSIQV